MEVVRGKFKVTAVTQRDPWAPYVEIELSAVYSNTPEDNSYAMAKPSGSIKMTVTNPEAIALLPVGKSFYVDFTPVDE
ncbi:MAG: hypothetical protein P4L40_21595 [Terracidiphilus sp.]|nr:hypothetical protein [Terracidiphilus sp.]